MIHHRELKDGSVRHTARVYRGDGKWKYGKARMSERAAKKDEAALLLEAQTSNETVDAYAARWLERYARHHKASSYDTAKGALKRFRKDFGSRRLDSIKRDEAISWVEKVPQSVVPIIVTMLNDAVDAELIPKNPFRKLGRRTKGRSDDAPPTDAELGKLLQACSALKEYAPMMRALITFAAYTGLRPGELYALEWDDIDFKAMRIRVTRRLYRSNLDVPKSGPKTIALTAPARDAILGLPRASELVFTAKRGGRLSQSLLSGYWHQVLAKADLDFDFYLATKHYCVHHLWTEKKLSERVIAEQMGWTLEETGKAIKKLLRIYGHGNIGALEEIDQAFAQNVTPLRAVEGGERR